MKARPFVPSSPGAAWLAAGVATITWMTSSLGAAQPAATPEPITTSTPATIERAPLVRELPSAPASGLGARPRMVSPGIADVVRLVEADVNTEIIKAYVKTATVRFNPSADEIVDLKNKGVPAEIITAMIVRGGEVRALAMPPKDGSAPPAPVAAQPYYAPGQAQPYDASVQASPEYSYPATYNYAAQPIYSAVPYNYWYSYAYPWYPSYSYWWWSAPAFYRSYNNWHRGPIGHRPWGHYAGNSSFHNRPGFRPGGGYGGPTRPAVFARPSPIAPRSGFAARPGGWQGGRGAGMSPGRSFGGSGRSFGGSGRSFGGPGRGR